MYRHTAQRDGQRAHDSGMGAQNPLWANPLWEGQIFDLVGSYCVADTPLSLDPVVAFAESVNSSQTAKLRSSFSVSRLRLLDERSIASSWTTLSARLLGELRSWARKSGAT